MDTFDYIPFYETVYIEGGRPGVFKMEDATIQVNGPNVSFANALNWKCLFDGIKKYKRVSMGMVSLCTNFPQKQKCTNFPHPTLCQSSFFID